MVDDLFVNKCEKYVDIKDRFWSKVDKKGEDECWLWKDAINGNGYGGFTGVQITNNNPEYHTFSSKAHRMAYIFTYGKILKGILVLHKCDNRLCCNPKHLFLGTHQDNMEDMVKKGRSKMCSFPNNKNSAKLTIKQVKKIRFMYRMEGMSYSKLSKIFNISIAQIGRIINREKWKDI